VKTKLWRQKIFAVASSRRLKKLWRPKAKEKSLPRERAREKARSELEC
jgi:hypothetical protein